MAIKPILFNTEMVRAILDGRKTCTRRLVKPQPKSRLCYTFAGSDSDTWGYPNRTAHEIWGEEFKLPNDITEEELSKRWNPPYHTGDILYVRETWQCWRAHRYEATADIRFRAGGDDVRLQFANGNTDSINRLDYDTFVHKWFSHNGEWKPSLFMPKEAARIWLRVTDVRIERLQEITIDGIRNEGFLLWQFMPETWRLQWKSGKTFGTAPSRNPTLTATVGMHRRGYGLSSLRSVRSRKECEVWLKQY